MAQPHPLIAWFSFTTVGYCPHRLRFWNRCPALFYPERRIEGNERFKRCRICDREISRLTRW